MRRTSRPRLIAFGLAIIAIAALSLAGQTARTGTATAGWPAAKEQIYQQQQQALATARAHPRPKVAGVGPAQAAVSLASRRAGIVAMRQGPFSPARFLVRNVWQGPIGSSWLLVYAGAERAPNGSSARGALRVYMENSDSGLTPVGTFPALSGSAPLTIVAVSGDVLQLRADDGAAFSFNLQVDQFQ